MNLHYEWIEKLLKMKVDPELKSLRNYTEQKKKLYI